MNIFKYKSEFSFKTLLVNILIPLLGGFVVGILNNNSKDLYESLEKPFLSPPSIVFPIVWGILYVLMGIAAYRVTLALRNSKVKKGELFFYYIQLLLNFLWPIIFFSFRLYGLAFIELIILFLFILITFFKFIKVDKWAGLLLLPYILWTTYAGYLNFFVWLLNEA